MMIPISGLHFTWDVSKSWYMHSKCLKVFDARKFDKIVCHVNTASWISEAYNILRRDVCLLQASPYFPMLSSSLSAAARNSPKKSVDFLSVSCARILFLVLHASFLVPFPLTRDMWFYGSGFSRIIAKSWQKTKSV